MAASECEDVFTVEFLNNALNELSKIFLKVCDKKSSSTCDKNNFDQLKKKILDTFEKHISDSSSANSIVVDTSASETSSHVMSRLDDLANQFELMKRDINTRFENLENKEIIHNIAASYASVTKTNNKSNSVEIVAPSDLNPRSIKALPNAESHGQKNTCRIKLHASPNHRVHLKGSISTATDFCPEKRQSRPENNRS
ncbi:hypothetical protein JTE90_010592 [Oedothorax gibbosus]|uniref:Uncharacterized protein n=1 Tax=Oedothorax gibbosus TaxID=931172 RepID=A0AAV6V676_9ARAC|nr:hypothetical protein JTE90_010592 [Oedothorax gibbosus]